MYPGIDILGVATMSTYGLAFMIGFGLAIILGMKIGKRYGLDARDILFAACYGGIFLFIGAKLMFFISKLPAILPKLDVTLELLKEDPIYVLNYLFGGLVFYGGLIGFVFGIWFYCRQFKLSPYPYMEVIPPVIPFVHAFGRIGCFLGGCCYGIEYHGPFAVQFPYNELIPELDDVPRFPVQLLEALLNFIVAGILLYLPKKVKLKTGQLLGIYILYYTVARFFLEMLRGDKIRGNVGGISTSQIVSMILLPIGIILVNGKWLQRRFEKMKEESIKENSIQENTMDE